MKATLKINNNRAGLYSLGIFVPFGKRDIIIKVDEPYTTERSAHRAAKAIAKKFGLTIKD